MGVSRVGNLSGNRNLRWDVELDPELCGDGYAQCVAVFLVLW